MAASSLELRPAQAGHGRLAPHPTRDELFHGRGHVIRVRVGSGGGVAIEPDFPDGGGFGGVAFCGEFGAMAG